MAAPAMVCTHHITAGATPAPLTRITCCRAVVPVGLQPSGCKWVALVLAIAWWVSWHQWWYSAGCERSRYMADHAWVLSRGAVSTPHLYGMASHKGGPWTHCIQLCLQEGLAFCHFMGDRPGFALQPPGSLLACAGPHWQPRGLLLAAFVEYGKGPCCTRLCTV